MVYIADFGHAVVEHVDGEVGVVNHHAVVERVYRL